MLIVPFMQVYFEWKRQKLILTESGHNGTRILIKSGRNSIIKSGSDLVALK